MYINYNLHEPESHKFVCVTLTGIKITYNSSPIYYIMCKIKKKIQVVVMENSSSFWSSMYLTILPNTESFSRENKQWSLYYWSGRPLNCFTFHLSWRAVNLFCSIKKTDLETKNSCIMVRKNYLNQQQLKCKPSLFPGCVHHDHKTSYLYPTMAKVQTKIFYGENFSHKIYHTWKICLIACWCSFLRHQIV